MVFPSGSKSWVGLVVALIVTLAVMLLPVVGVSVPEELKVSATAALVYYIGLLSSNNKQDIRRE